jgi:peptidyl-dipeptidase A
MPLRVAALLLPLLLFVISCGEREGASSTGDIRLTLDSLELKLARLDYRLAKETWAELTRGDADSLEFFQKLHKSVLSNEATFADLHGARLRLDRDVDRRRYDILYPLIVRTYTDQSDRVRPVYDTLVEFFSGNWCDYEGRLLSAAGLRQIMAHEHRRTDCELAYRALNAPGKPTADLLSRLIRLRNQAARRLGFNDYFSLVISSVRGSSEDYLKLIHQVDSVTSAEYRQALDALRRGPEGEIPEPWDWGLSFRNALDETDRYFPIGSQMLFVDISMAGFGFDLDNLPVYFQVSSDSSLPGESRLIVVNAPHDVRVVANQTGGIAGIGQLMYTIGQAIHVVCVSQDTELFSRVLDFPWTIGMGMFFQQLCYDTDWLRTQPNSSPVCP